MKPTSILLCLLPLLGGCMSVEDKPAIIVSPDAASHAELKRVLGSALGTTTILLAEDALTSTNRISIERAPLRNMQGGIDDRVLEMPEQFALVKRGPDCLLIQESSGERFLLRDVVCRPLKVE